MPESSTIHRRIYAVVSRIPRGRVATYGQVARLANLPGQARLVGYALSALPEKSRVPWHRVVNAGGQVSPRRDGGPMASIQRYLLERENVVFDSRGIILLARFRWRPRQGRRPN
jgi:methylated-DNA-protein-cysteine methyltransferase-like protein